MATSQKAFADIIPRATNLLTIPIIPKSEAITQTGVFGALSFIFFPPCFKLLLMVMFLKNHTIFLLYY